MALSYTTAWDTISVPLPTTGRSVEVGAQVGGLVNRTPQPFFWLAFVIVGVAGLAALSFALPPWSFQTLASEFGYHFNATAEQVTYGRKWCARRHSTRLISIDITYTRVSLVPNDVGTSAKFTPVLEIRCAFGRNKELDNSIHYMDLLFLNKPDEIPSN